MGSDEQQEPTTPSTIPTALLRNLRGRRALSDAELIDALIEFANTGSATAIALLNSGAAMTGSLLARWAGGPSPGTTQPGQLELREALTKIVDREVSERMVSDWRRRAASLVFLHEPGREGRYRWLVFEHWNSAPLPAIAYVLLLLFEGAFREQLCLCKWHECGRFFLATRPPHPDHKGGKRGAPVRGYCPGTDHREKARKIEARDRMRELRKERAKQSKRRR